MEDHRPEGLELVRMAIAHASVAGGLRYWARKEPSARRGLIKAADAHSERSSALLGQMVKPGAQRVRR